MYFTFYNFVLIFCYCCFFVCFCFASFYNISWHCLSCWYFQLLLEWPWYSC